MNTYTFNTINDKDFELLVLDLLNEELKLDLRSFKTGKDDGIDLRYSTCDNKNKIIVQAKHYRLSGYSQFKKCFQKDEYDKVKKLNPERYIIATTIELSPSNKHEIFNILQPFIKNENDIYSGNDINNLIRKHKDIELKHFKLWFSSTNVLSTIFNNAIEGRTRSFMERISNKLPLYVITDNLTQANTILASEKVLLITGDPGVGKTTLAEIILFDKAKEGFKVYLVNNVREAEDMISSNPEDNQLFYFDDFLGEVYYEIMTGSQKESEIAGFIERIKNIENKYIILSTRTVILEQAKNKSEKIKRSSIELAKLELSIKSYSRIEKAQILYNHLYFRNLENELLNTIIENKFYNTIISHKNYTPRIIEFITNAKRINKYSRFEYQLFITQNLDYPEEIWQDSYNNQIDYFDRCLLQTLITFYKNIDDKSLQTAFEERLKQERNINNKEINPEQFTNSIRYLLEGFINITLTNIDNATKIISLSNPSILDFLIGYLNRNYSIKKLIINSLIYIEQYYIFYKSSKNFNLEPELQDLIIEKIMNNKIRGISANYNGYINSAKIEILYNCCDIDKADKPISEILNLINIETDIIFMKLHLKKLVKIIKRNSEIYNYLKSNFDKFITQYIMHEDNYEDVLKLKIVFRFFCRNYDDFIEDDYNYNIVSNMISKCIISTEKDLMERYKNEMEDLDDFENYITYELDNIEESIIKYALPDTFSIEIERNYNTKSFEEQLDKNKIEREQRKENTVKSEEYFDKLLKIKEDEDTYIDDLFNLNIE
jgi:Holliday junction resolvasome RuvABC ATP-dependent DNA helicase subunit